MAQHHALALARPESLEGADEVDAEGVGVGSGRGAEVARRPDVLVAGPRRGMPPRAVDVVVTDEHLVSLLPPTVGVQVGQDASGVSGGLLVAQAVPAEVDADQGLLDQVLCGVRIGGQHSGDGEEPGLG